ncbi:tryptophan 7-halogenase [Kitasatospora camelliae]|uniref:Tryptophan 7-halogenase n=1 Tax=Kitasatospora camelliae TaxID=3156397 RepID=A0AAU8JPF2_9ACTN
MTVDPTRRTAATASSYDVVVAGGGPSGAAAAAALARAGRTVLLADAATGPPSLGEALPAAARVLLRDLGAGDLPGRHHLPCYAHLSAWGSAELATQDSILDPHGHGWHLDRARFDRELRDHARRSGAEVAEHTVVRPVGRSGGGTWTVELRGRHGSSGREAVRCRWLVDATGRRAGLATAAGARRVVHDRLVALCLTLPAPDGPATDGSTLVEAVPDGWWYTALLPGGRRLLARYTDADLPGARAGGVEPVPGLAGTRHTALRAAAHPWPDDPVVRRAPAHTARLDAVTGDGWTAVGDAAAAFDPLSSQGVLTALFTGLRAGEALHDHLGGDRTALAGYAAELDTVTAVHLRNRHAYYSLEGRWPRHPFWRRRHTAGATRPDGGRASTAPVPLTSPGVPA